MISDVEEMNNIEHGLPLHLANRNVNGSDDSRSHSSISGRGVGNSRDRLYSNSNMTAGSRSRAGDVDESGGSPMASAHGQLRVQDYNGGGGSSSST